MCRENSSLNSNPTVITGTLHEDRYIYLIIFPSIILWMRNVSDKRCKGILRCVIPVVCRITQNIMCTQYVVKHNLVLDGMLIY